MARHNRFVWVWLTFHRREVVLALAVIAIGLVLAVVWGPGLGPRTGRGFGPDWDCVDVGKGDPVCVKKPAANSGNPAPAAR